MDFKVNIDYKTIAALGASVVGTILVCKIEPSDVKEVLIDMVDACKELAIALVA